MKFLILLLPCVIALWVPLYNFEPPALFGIPFFYWFQLLMIPLSALAIFAATVLIAARAALLGPAEGRPRALGLLCALEVSGPPEPSSW